MDHNRHTVTKNINDEKTHAVINSKLFRKLNHVNIAIYDVELAKEEIEHKEPINVVSLNLQYAKLLMMKPYHKFH